jgi:hypothetical protein
MIENQIGHGPLSGSNALQRWNDLVDVVNDLQRYVSEREQTNGEKPGARPAMPDMFIGVTTAHDPIYGGGSDYTDARYYVTREVTPDPSTNPNYSGGALLDPLTNIDDPLNGHLSLPAYVTATNLAELPIAGGGNGTHTLPTGTRVFVIGIQSRQQPAHRTYFCVQGGVGKGNVVIKFGANLDAGYYDATIYSGLLDDSIDPNLTLPAGLVAGQSVLCVVTEEDHAIVDGAGNHYTAAQRIYLGSYATAMVLPGLSSEGTPRPMVLVRGGVGTMGGATIIYPSGGFTSPTADTNVWTRAVTGTPLDAYVMTRGPVVDDAAQTLTMFYRIFSFDARGLLYREGAEQLVVMYTGATCPSGGTGSGSPSYMGV